MGAAVQSGASANPAAAAAAANPPQLGPRWDAPPAYGDKAAAGLYTPSAPWLTDVFVESTTERE